MNEEIKTPSGAALFAVDTEKFKWIFTGVETKPPAPPEGSPQGNPPKRAKAADTPTLVVKDIAVGTPKPLWSTIKECVFRVKKMAMNSKLSSVLNLKEGDLLYFNSSLFALEMEDTDEIEVFLFQTFCVGYAHNINSTKATETLKTVCGSLGVVGKVPEQTVEINGYSVKETTDNKDDILQSYIEKSHFSNRDVSVAEDGKGTVGQMSKPKNFKFIFLLVDQTLVEDQRTKFFTVEGQIATFNPAQDLSNQKVDLQMTVTPSSSISVLTYDFVSDATFFEI